MQRDGGGKQIQKSTYLHAFWVDAYAAEVDWESPGDCFDFNDDYAYYKA